MDIKDNFLKEVDLMHIDLEEKLLIYLAIITDLSSDSGMVLGSAAGMQQQVQTWLAWQISVSS